MSQAEFAKVTGFGLASVKRWETGAIVQNQSADRLLRLLQADGSLMNKLLNLYPNETSITNYKPVFRTKISSKLRAAALSFKLRLTAS